MGRLLFILVILLVLVLRSGAQSQIPTDPWWSLACGANATYSNKGGGSFTYFGACGTNASDNFWDDTTAYLNQFPAGNVWAVSLFFDWGSYLTSITTVSNNGKSSGQAGDGGGGSTGQFLCSPGEQLQFAWMRYQKYADILALSSKMQLLVFGIGTGVSTSSYKFNPGQIIVGFFGSYGSVVNSIGLITWTNGSN